MFLLLETAVVSPACPLLSAEQAVDYLPQVSMRVPRDTAWVALQVDLVDFIDERGDVDRASLDLGLQQAVLDGDRQHDATEWAEPPLKHDSWMNRRLAIAIRGWGDVIHRSAMDPEAVTTLRTMEGLAEWVVKTTQGHSRQLAHHTRWCPALDEVGADLMRQGRVPRWSRRWQRAVREVATRHRNLTTMSPWDLFPRGRPADLRFANLLPLTRFVDSLSFQCDVDISHWNVNEFKGFYERLAAIAASNGGAGLIAKQV